MLVPVSPGRHDFVTAEFKFCVVRFSSRRPRSVEIAVVAREEIHHEHVSSLLKAPPSRRLLRVLIVVKPT